MVHPHPSPEFLTAFYSSGYDGRVKSGIVEARDAKANQAAIEDGLTRLRYIAKHAGPQNGRVLDVGCGHGFFLMAAGSAGLEATGIDIDEDAVAYGNNVLGVRILPHPIDDLGRFAETGFDLVTFWQVLEHLPEPGKSVKAAADLLRPGGIVAGSMPNIGGVGARLQGDTWYLMVPPEHLTYLDEASCATMLRNAGFEPLFVGTIPLYASPYFKLGLRAGLMRWAQTVSSPAIRTAAITLHRGLTLFKRHVVYGVLNVAVIASGAGGNSVFFVARKPVDASCDSIGAGGSTVSRPE